MKRQRKPRLGCPRSRPAFTLIELMVVITIIAILIGLLVPAVGAVRRIAKETATKAVLSALDIGLESFKADGIVGGTYPPSSSDVIAQSVSKVMSPYTVNKQISISGAGLLVWALSGADGLGTPGFHATRLPEWSNCTGNTYSPPPRPSDLYAIYPYTDPTKPGQPVYARKGPYVDQSKVKTTANRGGPGTADFTSDAEMRARESLGKPFTPGQGRNYPMYLDAFGYPVLYWQADTAGTQLADRDATTSGTGRALYHWGDSGVLASTIVTVQDEPWLILSSGGDRHKLSFAPGSFTPSTPPPVDSFQYFIRNAGIQAQLRPHRDDSYLLVSPGGDGLYGTADDIANFSHNGR